MRKTIHYIDMFRPAWAASERGLTRAGDFVCRGTL